MFRQIKNTSTSIESIKKQHEKQGDKKLNEEHVHEKIETQIRIESSKNVI